MSPMTLLAKAAQRVGIRPNSRLYRSLARNYWGVRSIRGSRYYSQFGEDITLLNLLGAHQDGIYVDIGAGHPTQGSNTYALYRLGWSGTLVEPLPYHRALTKAIRPRDHLIQSLCGAETGTATLYEYDPWQLSTISAEVVDRLADQGFRPVATHDIDVIPLRDLGLRVNPTSPSLLSLDVEGNESAVLAGNDWAAFMPSVICVEEWQSPLAAGDTVRSLLASHGYSLHNYIGNSGIYVHEVWSARNQDNIQNH